MSNTPPAIRDAMSHFATGVAVVASREADGTPCATTINALTSVSLEPPLILVCLGRDSKTLSAIKNRRKFSVSVLAGHQDEISNALARRGIDADLIDRGIFVDNDHEIPLIDEALTHITCDIHQLHDGGDHEIVIGHVRHAEVAVGAHEDGEEDGEEGDADAPPQPLIFYRSRYAHLHGHKTIDKGSDVGPAGARVAPRISVRPRRGETEKVDVAIIGGGVSGALTAYHLLINGPAGTRVAIVEEHERIGPGVAYGTDRSAHLLNVPAVLMNAIPDRPGHFLDWARREIGGVTDCDYLPRQVFGHYIEHVLADSERAARGRVELVHVHDRAVRVNRTAGNAFRLDLNGGGAVEAGAAVLATGNSKPANPGFLGEGVAESGVYIRDPWQPGAIDRVRSDEQVLAIGTGLTMVDVALSLGNAGGPVIHAVSRTGLIPRAHLAGVPFCGQPVGVPEGEASLSDLTTRILARVATAESGAGNWRQAFDSLRPISNDLWRSLSPDDRRRFFDEGLVRIWNVHRHRMAPGIAEAIDRLVETRRLRVHAGSINRIELHHDGARVEFVAGDVDSRSEPSRIHVDKVINCTGPVYNPNHIESDLFRNLIADGLVTANELGVGVATTIDARLIDADGKPADNFFAIGPLRFGDLLETTAVVEIGQQAEALGRQLLTGATAGKPSRPGLRSAA